METLLPGRIISALIDYNFIVNTDIGLIRFIRENYQDPKAFKLDVVNKSDREILLLLYTRININPLSIISTEENMNDIDKLYESFMNSFRADIVKRSIVDKSINRFIKLALEMGTNTGTKVSIGVNNGFEEYNIKKHYPNAKVVNNEDDDNASYISYYLRDYSYLIKYGIDNNPNNTDKKKILINRKIYIPPTEYNIVYFGAHKEISYNNVISFMGNDYGNILKEEANYDK